MDFEIDAIDDVQDYWYNPPNYDRKPEPTFHQAIFSCSNHERHFSKTVSFDPNSSFLDHRIDRSFSSSLGTMISAHQGGGSVQGGATISWGGSEGTKVDVTIKGEIHDGKGNSAEVKGTQSSDGKGSVSVSGSSGTKDKPSDSSSPPKK